MALLVDDVAALAVDDARVAAATPEDVVAYRVGRKTLVGLKGDEAGSIYANVGFNRFAESATALPEGAEAVELSARMLRECYFDPTRRRLRPAAATELPTGAAFKIVDGEDAPFVAYAGDGACAVYRLPPDGYLDDRDVTGDLERDRLFYTDKVVEIDDPLRVRRGGDPTNSLLVHVEDDLFVYVGSEIFAFTAPSAVEAYVSPLGATDNPYPVAVTQSHVLFLLERAMVPRAAIEPHLGDEGWQGAYAVFYERHYQRRDAHAALPDLKVIAERVD